MFCYSSLIEHTSNFKPEEARVDSPKLFILNRLIFKRACGSIHLTRLLFLTCLFWVKHNISKQGVFAN